MEMIVEVKNVYGNQVIYPINEIAKTFAKLAGTKTLTIAAVELIKTLGYIVRVSQPVVTL